MNFTSYIYGIFLIFSLFCYWVFTSLLPQFYHVKLMIIVALSFIFYLSYQDNYILLFLLLLILGINFLIGKALALPQNLKEEENSQLKPNFWASHKPILLSIGITFNVLLLLGLKYIPFFLNSVGQLFNLPVALESANWIDDHLIVPLGLSFFTFENLAYLIDVYRGAPPTSSFLSFAGYKFFFPKLISGPITRYHTFARQLKKQKFPAFEDWIEGVWLIACGALKKALIADRLGTFVELCFNNLERAGSVDLCLMTLAYGLQLYLDFSGYVDIARGSAKLLGINLPENFDFPYFTTSIAQFWRRWHITLGDWLRNYLYFSLGGSRRGFFRTCLNLFLVMLIAGIWHGAAWGFILWGAFHGLALVIHRCTDKISQETPALKQWWTTIPGKLSAWLITQLMVFLAWISFRLPNVAQAGLVYQRLWGYEGDAQFVEKVYTEALEIDRPYIAISLILILGIMGLVYLVQRRWKMHLNWPLKLVLVPLCLYCVWLFSPEGGLPYIYFDF